MSQSKCENFCSNFLLLQFWISELNSLHLTSIFNIKLQFLPKDSGLPNSHLTHLRFSVVFRGLRKGALGANGLIQKNPNLLNSDIFPVTTNEAVLDYLVMGLLPYYLKRRRYHFEDASYL